MRSLVLVLAAGLAAATPAKAVTWFAVCQGSDAQYMQEVGGAGFLHVAHGDGTYDTQRLIQSFYDGKVLCGANDPKSAQSQSEIAEVCADKAKRTVSVTYKSRPHKLPMTDSDLFCPANIKVH